MSKKHLILLAVIHVCNGKESNNIFPQTVNAEGTAEISIYPPTRSYSNAFAAAVNSVTWLPQAVASVLGPVTQPNFISNTEKVGNDKISLFDMDEATENEDSTLEMSPARVYSNPFAAAVNAVTWVPKAVASALGPVTQPSFISSTKKVDKISQFVIDFTEATENEDANLEISQLIHKYGFPVEVHAVVTTDGYELTMFRIPSNGSAVFLMHGLLGSADDFVIAGRESGLAYLLADGGYDVWMGNARGNKHSRKHIILEPSYAEFWDFSWHEIGVYDLPAMINYVLNKTDEHSLKYIGHSQGTTAFFVMVSEKPEYNNKVSVMIAMSPVVFMGHARSPIVRLMSPGTYILNGFLKSLGQYEFLPDNNVVRTLKLMICGTGVLAELLCSNTLFLMSGYDFEQLNVTNLPVVFAHLPSGASMKQLAHYGQGVLSNKFRKFDYSSEENLIRYGVRVPPSYDLRNVMTPVSMFVSDSDWLAHPTDVNRLRDTLMHVVSMYKIPYKQFNHVDFIIAKDVKELVYKRLLEELAWF